MRVISFRISHIYDFLITKLTLIQLTFASNRKLSTFHSLQRCISDLMLPTCIDEQKFNDEIKHTHILLLDISIPVFMMMCNSCIANSMQLLNCVWEFSMRISIFHRFYARVCVCLQMQFYVLINFVWKTSSLFWVEIQHSSECKWSNRSRGSITSCYCCCSNFSYSIMFHSIWINSTRIDL